MQPDGTVAPQNPWEPGVDAAQALAAEAAAQAASQLGHPVTPSGYDVSSLAGVTPESVAASGSSAPSVTAFIEAGSKANDPMGAWYRVVWGGILKVQESDRVVVLMGANPSNKQHPIKFYFVGEAAPGTYMSGSGSVRCAGGRGSGVRVRGCVCMCVCGFTCV